jgi:ubiquinone/menaquinone biosynthesis C-methylase UbiE
MSTSYFIEDGESAAETARLLQLHACLARYLRDVTADLLGPSAGQQVLDIGCGPGGWVLGLAERVPQAQVIGIDVSPTRIASAQKLAVARDLSHVRFLVMDAAKALGFPDASFDLIHARFVQSFLPTAAWPPFLRECRRVLRPGGRLVLTECENPISTSSAFERLCAAYAEASRRTGFGYTPCGSQLGITAMLAVWLRQADYEGIEQVVQAIDFSAGAPAHEDVVRYFQMVLPLSSPFLVHSGAISQTEVAALSRLALSQMRESGFCSLWYVRTVWGSRPA